jgi:hypothetical protein
MTEEKKVCIFLIDQVELLQAGTNYRFCWRIIAYMTLVSHLRYQQKASKKSPVVYKNQLLIFKVLTYYLTFIGWLLVDHVEHSREMGSAHDFGTTSTTSRFIVDYHCLQSYSYFYSC